MISKSVVISGHKIRFIVRDGRIGLVAYDVQRLARQGFIYDLKCLESWPRMPGVGSQRHVKVLVLTSLPAASPKLGISPEVVDEIISAVRGACDGDDCDGQLDLDDVTKRDVNTNVGKRQANFVMEPRDEAVVEPVDDEVEEWTVTIPAPRNALVQVDTAKTFDFAGIQLRVELDDAGEAWFQVNDVCQALGYENARDALAKHVDLDDVAKRDVIDSMGRNQKANFVNESGLYALCMGSKLEGAKRFKRWVTSEVLPTIRKTGSYTAPAQAEVPLLSNENVLAMAKQLVSTTERAEALEADVVAKDASLTKGRQLYRQLRQEVESLRPDAESWRDRHAVVETLFEMADRLGVSWWDLARAMERRGCLYRLRNGKLVPSTHPRFRDFFDMQTHGSEIGITAYGQRELAKMVSVAR